MVPATLSGQRTNRLSVLAAHHYEVDRVVFSIGNYGSPRLTDLVDGLDFDIVPGDLCLAFTEDLQ